MKKKIAFLILILFLAALIPLSFCAKRETPDPTRVAPFASPAETRAAPLSAPAEIPPAESDPVNKPLPENVVIDPESGQYVLFNELTILASGEDVKKMVEEFHGEIVVFVEETDVYQVRFPVKDLNELKRIRLALESKKLTVYYVAVIIP